MRATRHPAGRLGQRGPRRRSRHGAGAGPDPAGHDRRLRRQPYGDTRGLRGPGLRHRHLRGRPCAGDPVSAATQAQGHAGDSDRPPATRRVGQGRGPDHHRPSGVRRRHGSCDRIRRRGHPVARHGRPDDGLQHVDRGGRPGRHDRARPGDRRLAAGPSACALRGGFRTRRRRLADPQERSRCGVRQRDRNRRKRDPAHGDLGHNPRCRLSHRRAGSRTARRQRGPGSGLYGLCRGRADHRSRRRCRLRRFLHQRTPARSARGRRRPEGTESQPGRAHARGARVGGGAPRRRGRRSGPRLHRRRCRMAPARLFHVHRHER